LLAGKNPLPEQFYKGIKQFNRQEFFEAHETLESVWRGRKTPDRVFVQGIIQIAAGCHHLRNNNIEGARSLLGQGLAKLEPFSPTYAGMDVKSFIRSVLDLECRVKAVRFNLKDIGSWPHIFCYKRG
jgi:uncharacterized protein